MLIVEDDYLLATDLAAMLRRAGANVVGPVGSVPDALDALDPLPDIASLDVQLGDETSFRVADELARRGVPFIFATGTPADIPPAHNTRIVCSKPVSDSTVLKALADALDGGRNPTKADGA